MSRYSRGGWPAYVPVSERRRRAARKVAKMKKAGQETSPVEIAGRKITTTFWGSAWCKNLEAYSDYSNRLPRGRSYARNGSVLDLQIEAGRIHALVSGTRIYQVEVVVKPLAKRRWTQVKKRCAGEISSLVELLQGSLSKSVMEIATDQESGLFPSPREISLSCSCPDWAVLCKHVAATLYGVGARLDHQPELLFTLRGLDPSEMVDAATLQPPPTRKPKGARLLQSDQLSSLFGIDIEPAEAPAKKPSKPAKKPTRARRTKKQAAAKTRPKSEKKPTAKKAATKKATATATARKAVTKKAATKKPAATAKKATAKKAARTKPVARKKPPRKQATQKPAVAKKAAIKKAVPKKAAPKKAAARKVVAKKTVAKKITTKKAPTKGKARPRKAK